MHKKSNCALLLFFTVSHSASLPQQSPPVDNLRSCEDIRAQSSASSMTSLPLGSLPSISSLSLTSDPPNPQLHPEAMLAEIAQLSRQNDLIRAQLSHAKRLRSGVRGSPNSSGEQRRLSSSSSERISPRSIGERRTSSSTGRPSQDIQVAESGTHQVRMKLHISNIWVKQSSHLVIITVVQNISFMSEIW